MSNFFSRNFYEKPKKTALCENNFIFKQNQQKNKYLLKLLCVYRFLIYPMITVFHGYTKKNVVSIIKLEMCSLIKSSEFVV